MIHQIGRPAITTSGFGRNVDTGSGFIPRCVKFTASHPQEEPRSLQLSIVKAFGRSQGLQGVTEALDRGAHFRMVDPSKEAGRLPRSHD